MNFITLLILVFIILAAGALFWWAVQRLALPEPFKTVVLLIIGLVALALLYNFIAGGHVPVFR
jgi:Co/Zn/Cd efflux system component